MRASTCQQWNLSRLPFMRYRTSGGSTIRPLVTPNELWPPPKQKGFCICMCHPSMRYLSLQGFRSLPRDLRWPFSFTQKPLGYFSKYNATTFQVWKTFIIPYLRYGVSEVQVQFLTYGNLKCPLNSTKTMGFFLSISKIYIPNIIGNRRKNLNNWNWKIKCLNGVRTRAMRMRNRTLCTTPSPYTLIISCF